MGREILEMCISWESPYTLPEKFNGGRERRMKREAHLEDGRQQDPDSKRKNQFPREPQEAAEEGERERETRVKPRTGMTVLTNYRVYTCMGGESVACLSLVLHLNAYSKSLFFSCWCVFTPLPSPGIFSTDCCPFTP